VRRCQDSVRFPSLPAVQARLRPYRSAGIKAWRPIMNLAERPRNETGAETQPMRSKHAVNGDSVAGNQRLSAGNAKPATSSSG
jgi:hypothetical protein